MVKGFGLSASKHDRAARAVPRTRRTTYAASSALIGKNTVASPQVVNGSLQTKDLSAKARKALKGTGVFAAPRGQEARRERRVRRGRPDPRGWLARESCGRSSRLTEPLWLLSRAASRFRHTRRMGPITCTSRVRSSVMQSRSASRTSRAAFLRGTSPALRAVGRLPGQMLSVVCSARTP